MFDWLGRTGDGVNEAESEQHEQCTELAFRKFLSKLVQPT